MRGGTFTDFVLQDANGRLHTGKRLTTYPDPSEACLAGLDELMRRTGIAWQDLARAVHGTTLGSNVVIERKATGVALATTRGFRDVLAIGLQKRYQLYDLQSARTRRARPGPACYARGGDKPTVTDANLLLGYLDPDGFAGGTMRLDVEAARHAIETAIAGPLEMSVEEAAWGIHAMVNLNMEVATRVV